MSSVGLMLLSVSIDQNKFWFECQCWTEKMAQCWVSEDPFHGTYYLTDKHLWRLSEDHTIFIDREAREIIRLVASVRLFVCLFVCLFKLSCLTHVIQSKKIKDQRPPGSWVSLEYIGAILRKGQHQNFGEIPYLYKT